MSRRYLTNLDLSLMGLVTAAIRNSGRHDIHIDPEPMPVTNFPYTEETRNTLIANYFSIYVDPEKDTSSFWREFRRLSETDYWQTYLKLTS